MDLFKVRNEDTPGNQVELENGKIYNSMFTFKEDAPIEKKWMTSLKVKSYTNKRSATDISY